MVFFMILILYICLHIVFEQSNEDMSFGLYLIVNMLLRIILKFVIIVFNITRREYEVFNSIVIRYGPSFIKMCPFI